MFKLTFQIGKQLEKGMGTLADFGGHYNKVTPITNTEDIS
jgi:hypothetical protein